MEFDKILNILSNFSNTYIGKDLCLSLRPFSQKNDIINALEETKEAEILLQRKGSLPINTISDITAPLKILKASSFLSTKQLLDLANIFKISRELKEYFSLDIGIVDNFSSLH